MEHPMSTTLTRTAADQTVPAAGTYVIDATHSDVRFQVRHLGLSKVTGGFSSFAGTVEIGEDLLESSASVELDVQSFSTGNADRDAHVLSADFLDADAHPTIRFASTGLRAHKGAWLLDGDLTIKGITRPVTLDVAFEGAGTDPWGNGRIAFEASAQINREDFGITWNQALEAGGVLVGRTVKIEIAAQAVASV
jgi:polyisoprenoid-binding protein YceI